MEALPILAYYYSNLDNQDYSADIIFGYSRVYNRLGQMDSVRNILERHLSDVRLMRNRNIYGRSLLQFSYVYKMSSLYSEALKFQYKALDVATNCNDTSLQVMCHNSMSGIYYKIGDYAKAMQVLKQALTLLDTAKYPKLYHDMLTNMGTVAFHKNQYQLASSLFLETEKWYKQSNVKENLPLLYSNIIEIYLKEGKLDSALIYGKKMLESNDPNNLFVTANTFAGLGAIYDKMGNYNKAYHYIMKSINIGLQNNYTSILQTNYQVLNQYFESQGMVDSAYYYLKKLRELEEQSDLKEVHKTFEVYETRLLLFAKDSTLAEVTENYTFYSSFWQLLSLSISAIAAFTFVLSIRRKKKLCYLEEEKDKLEDTLKEAEALFSKKKNVVENDYKLLQCIYREFRDQIQGIMFSSDVLESEIKQNTFAKNYEAPIKILNQTSGMLRKFLDYIILYNDINKGEIEMHPEQTNISEIVNRCVRILQKRAKLKNISIIHLSNFYSCNTDRNLVEFIVITLLSNSIKYSHPFQTVEISYEVINSNLYVNFIDNGVGICDDIMEIEAPERIKSRPGTKGEKGTGMSLIVAQKMATLLNSSIKYNNNQDLGATFTLTIPHVVEIIK